MHVPGANGGQERDICVEEGRKLSKRYLQFEFGQNVEEHAHANYLIAEITRMRKYRQKERPDSIREFRDRFIVQMSHDEAVGLQDEDAIRAITAEMDSDARNFDVEYPREIPGEGENPRLETKNMLKAFRFFDRRHTDFDGISFLSEDIVKLSHEILMKGLLRNAGYLAETDRETVCPITNEKVMYPKPEFVKTVLAGLLDHSNYIACYLMNKIQQDITEEVVEEIIKFSAWFFYNFVSLHPFTNGNGRLSRLLYCYIQRLMSPFAVGVYNIFAPTSKMDYYKAICQAREDVKLHLKGDVDSVFKKNGWMYESKPSNLARMILECQWHAWKKFVSECETVSYERSLSDEYLQTGSLEEY